MQRFEILKLKWILMVLRGGGYDTSRLLSDKEKLIILSSRLIMINYVIKVKKL